MWEWSVLEVEVRLRQPRLRPCVDTGSVSFPRNPHEPTVADSPVAPEAA